MDNFDYIIYIKKSFLTVFNLDVDVIFDVSENMFKISFSGFDLEKNSAYVIYIDRNKFPKWYWESKYSLTNEDTYELYCKGYNNQIDCLEGILKYHFNVNMDILNRLY